MGLGDYLLLALFLLIAPGVLSAKSTIFRTPIPLSKAEAIWLVAGYIATFTFYVFVGLRLWNDVLASGGS